MAEKKHSAFALLEILTKYSDENHILTTKQLQEHLANTYGLNLERRTLYSNLEILEQAGYVLSKFDDNGKGYFLEEKQFDKGEVLLLCNAIHASHFISEKQSQKLINKLLNTLSTYEKYEFSDNAYMPNPLKTNNNDLMYNISLISEAIRDNKCIKFTYMKYGKDRKLISRREKPYTVEPRYIVYADSRPYLISTSLNHPGYGHYRIDKITKASLLQEDIRPLRKDEDAYQYARNKLFMFGGDSINVTYLCKEDILDHIIDIVGTDAYIVPREDGNFILSIQTSRQGATFLAQQFIDAIEILEPQDLKEEFIELIEDRLKAYKK